MPKRKRLPKSLLDVKQYKQQVYRLYCDGNSLGKISREVKLDISSVLFVLRKCKIPKKALYSIFEIQLDRTNSENVDLFLENEKFYVDKFFPNTGTNYFSSSYVWYWKEKYKKLEESRHACQHRIKNIACASCGKILADASNIQTNNITE